jgi:hypothetical protein
MDNVIGSYTEWQQLETALVGRVNHDVKSMIKKNTLKYLMRLIDI